MPESERLKKSLKGQGQKVHISQGSEDTVLEATWGHLLGYIKAISILSKVLNAFYTGLLDLEFCRKMGNTSNHSRQDGSDRNQLQPVFSKDTFI